MDVDVLNDYQPNEVYGTFCGGLGDHWAFGNFIALLSAYRQTQINISHRVIDRVQKCVGFFNPEKNVRYVENDPTILFFAHTGYHSIDDLRRENHFHETYRCVTPPKFIYPWYTLFKYPYIQIAEQNRVSPPIVTIQPAGKNPDNYLPEIDVLEQHLRNMGVLPVRVGLPYFSIEDSLKRLTESIAFIGIDSGMAHMAHSVKNLPVFIFKTKSHDEALIRRNHCGNPYTLITSMEEVLQNMKKYLA